MGRQVRHVAMPDNHRSDLQVAPTRRSHQLEQGTADAQMVFAMLEP